MVRTIIDPSYVWRYWENNKEKARDFFVILATSPDNALDVALHTDSGGVPYVVIINDEDIFATIRINASNAESATARLIDCIDKVGLSEPKKSRDNSKIPKGKEFDNTSSMESTEDALDLYLRKFILTVAEDKKTARGILDNPIILDDIKNRVLQYVSNRYDIGIRRVMGFTNHTTGEVLVTDHPYEEMVYCGHDRRGNGGWKIKSRQ